MKASTLPEVLISLSLLSLLLTLGMGLFSIQAGKYSPVQRFKTRNMVQEYLLEPMILGTWQEEKYLQGRHLVKKRLPCEANNSAYWLMVSAYQDSLLIDQHLQLITPSLEP